MDLTLSFTEFIICFCLQVFKITLESVKIKGTPKIILDESSALLLYSIKFWLKRRSLHIKFRCIIQNLGILECLLGKLA